MKILNLTQHCATPDQLAAGVIEPKANLKPLIQKWLTFEVLPSEAEIIRRANKLADIALEHDCQAVMIGGAPFLMSRLEAALLHRRLTPVYAFSKRETVESLNAKGEVEKFSRFAFAGFIGLEEE